MNKLPDQDPMEKAMADRIDREFRKPLPKAGTASMAEQLIGIAESVKSIHRDIDALEQDFTNRLNELRNRLGSSGS